ncbi:MAG: hypothetical protein IPJ82_13430 [Lewinellaceae bacterium]|nr:hypothetical protein [Lewinellaceae bacterium]
MVVGAWEPDIALAVVNAAPNPFRSETVLEVKGLKNNDPLVLQLFDFQGNVIQEITSNTQRSV